MSIWGLNIPNIMAVASEYDSLKIMPMDEISLEFFSNLAE
jgi:hypothetical protein